jgi:cell division protein FtsB
MDAVLRQGLAEVLRQRKRRIELKMEMLDQSLELLEKLGRPDLAEQARERLKSAQPDDSTGTR